MLTQTPLRFLAALAASTALAAPAAEAETLWTVATASSRGGALLPAPVVSSVADASRDLIVVANQGDASNSCIVTLKYHRESGRVMWRQELCAGAGTLASAVAVDPSGDVVVLGTANGGFRLLKYAGANGALRWDRPSGNSGEMAFSVAITRAGDIFVLGAARGFTLDLWTAKHRGTDGALAWQQPVEAGADVEPAGIAVDGAGNALVAGTYRNARGDEDWHVAKLAGSSGAVLWRKVYDSGARDVASGIAVDSNGHVVVAGTSGGAQVALRVVKSDGASGRTVWDAAFDGGARAGIGNVHLDGGNNVVVAGHVAAGSGSDIQVLKLAEGDGRIVWQSRQAGGGMATGRSAATDSSTGETYVVGTTHANGAEMRTFKLAASDGRVEWSAAQRADAGQAAVAAPGIAYAVGVSTEAQGTGLRVVRYGERAVLPMPALRINVQGLWWRGPEESGWGLNIAQQGDVLFATWFTYDEQGQPQWLVMSEGRRIEDNGFSGTLYRTRGPAFSAAAFDPSQVTREAVGTATLRFTDSGNGTFTYDVGGRSATKAITKQVFSSPQPQCVQGGSSTANPNFQDLWWAPEGREAGWGLNIAHQGDTLFITWFTYAADGRGTWLVGSKVERTGNNSYAGTLFRTVGPPLGAEPWSASRVAVAAAGEARLSFTDANNGTFSYTLDGVTQSKTVTRQVYATPKTVCR